jgi:hypothetical protein
MMFKVETSTPKEWLAAACGGDADFLAGERRAGTAGHGPAGAVSACTIQTDERGAL